MCLLIQKVFQINKPTIIVTIICFLCWKTECCFSAAGYRNSVDFPFYPESDTIVSVLCEMIEQISDLSGEYLVPIVQLMEQLIPKLKPHYKPPCDFSLAEYISSLEDSSASNCILDALRYLLESGMCKTSTEVIGIGEDRCARDSLVSGISVEHNLVNQNHDSGLSACDCSEVSCW